MDFLGINKLKRHENIGGNISGLLIHRDINIIRKIKTNSTEPIKTIFPSLSCFEGFRGIKNSNLLKSPYKFCNNRLWALV